MSSADLGLESRDVASVLERPAWASAGCPDGCTPAPLLLAGLWLESTESAWLGQGQVGAGSMALGIFLGLLSMSTSPKCWAFVGCFPSQ